MNKLISKIVGVALGLTLAVGTGVAVLTSTNNASKVSAADSSVATAVFNKDNNQDSISSYTATWTNITNGFSWTLANFNNNKTCSTEATPGTWGYVKCGRKNNASVANITTTNAVSNIITKVDITIDSFTNGKINSIKLYGGASATTEIGSYTVATGTQSVTIPAANRSANQKYKVEFDCASGSGNGLLQLSKVELFEDASDVYPTSISCSAQSIAVLDTVDLSDEVVFTNSGGNTVTVKNLSFAIASGSDYIDLDTTTGVVKGKKSGTATVTITADTNASGGTTSCTATITVSAISASGLTVGDQYALYAVDETNSYEGELTGVSNSVGTVAAISDETPSCNYLLDVENGYFENTVAFSLANGTYLSFSGTSNQLKTESSVTATSSWKVTWNSSTNEAVILNADNLARSLQFNYNSGNPRFACYTTVQVPVCLYHFEDKALTDFTIDASISVYKTGTATIGVTYTPADASDKTLTWASSNDNVATVADGVVTGVEVGTCDVTASKVIGGVTVTRTCAVTVLNNKAAHLGTSADPFNVNDAVNVANGVFTQTSNGTAIDLTNTYYYVEGTITKNVNRTTSTLTFWIGDEASQQSAATGGFEIFKVGKVYGQNLGTYYTAESEVQRDFNVGYKVKASGKLTVYNGTPEMDTGGYIYYNSYIEARTFATAFNTALEAVCDADGNTAAADLASAWSTQGTAFAALASDAQTVLTNATAKTSSSATAVELCAAKYDYILGKYGTSTLSNFMNRTVAASSANTGVRTFATNNNGALIVVVITAFVSATFIGGYFFLHKKKEN